MLFINNTSHKVIELFFSEEKSEWRNMEQKSVKSGLNLYKKWGFLWI